MIEKGVEKHGPPPSCLLRGATLRARCTKDSEDRLCLQKGPYTSCTILNFVREKKILENNCPGTLLEKEASDLGRQSNVGDGTASRKSRSLSSTPYLPHGIEGDLAPTTTVDVLEDRLKFCPSVCVDLYSSWHSHPSVRPRIGTGK